MEGEKLAQDLMENGISVQGVDVLASAKETQLTAPEALKIRFSKAVRGESALTGLADKIRNFTGKEPKLVDASAGHGPGTCEIWFSKP